MGFFDKVRKRQAAPVAAPELVRCPACGERNRPSAVACTICRGALPPHPGQQVRSPAPPR